MLRSAAPQRSPAARPATDRAGCLSMLRSAGVHYHRVGLDRPGPAVQQHGRRGAEVLAVYLPGCVVDGVAGPGGEKGAVAAAERRLSGQYVVQLLGLVLVVGVVEARTPQTEPDPHGRVLDDRVRAQQLHVSVVVEEVPAQHIQVADGLAPRQGRSEAEELLEDRIDGRVTAGLDRVEVPNHRQEARLDAGGAAGFVERVEHRRDHGQLRDHRAAPVELGDPPQQPVYRHERTLRHTGFADLEYLTGYGAVPLERTTASCRPVVAGEGAPHPVGAGTGGDPGPPLQQQLPRPRRGLTQAHVDGEPSHGCPCGSADIGFGQSQPTIRKAED